METLFALLSPALAQPALVDATATIEIDGCLMKQWATDAYYMFVKDPWGYYPVITGKNWTSVASHCGSAEQAGVHPLGPRRSVVYAEGGYGMIREPLLQKCSAEDAARFGCSNGSHPTRLSDSGLYAQLSIQARPNAFPHSEVDFGSFKWDAYGSSMLSEFGYGTIASR